MRDKGKAPGRTARERTSRCVSAERTGNAAIGVQARQPVSALPSQHRALLVLLRDLAVGPPARRLLLRLAVRAGAAEEPPVPGGSRREERRHRDADDELVQELPE